MMWSEECSAKDVELEGLKVEHTLVCVQVIDYTYKESEKSVLTEDSNQRD